MNGMKGNLEYLRKKDIKEVLSIPSIRHFSSQLLIGLHLILTQNTSILQEVKSAIAQTSIDLFMELPWRIICILGRFLYTTNWRRPVTTTPRSIKTTIQTQTEGTISFVLAPWLQIGTFLPQQSVWWKINFLMIRGCSQMTSAFFGVSDTPWCLCQPIISFWHAPWCFKLMTSFVNHPEPKMIIFRIQFISIRFNRICVTYYIAMEKSKSLLQKGFSSA